MKTIFLVLILTMATFAQVKPASNVDDKSKTDLELFTEKYGTVVVQGYSTLPAIVGSGGTFEVLVKEFRISSGTTKTKGLVVEVDTGERYSSSARSFIEYAELESLIKGITYISKIDKSVTTLDNFEAKYRTKDDFSITVFNSRNTEKLNVAITVGRIGSKSVFLTIDRLAELVLLFERAKTKLDSL